MFDRIIVIAALALLMPGCIIPPGGPGDTGDPDDPAPQADRGAAPDGAAPDSAAPDSGAPDGDAPDLGEPGPCGLHPTPPLTPPDPHCTHLHPVELPPPPPHCVPGNPVILGHLTVERDHPSFEPPLPGDDVSVSIHHDGRRPPTGWWVTGEMPPGLQFDPCTAQITGTLGWPEGRVEVVALFEDAAGCQTLTTSIDFGELTPCAIHVEPTETTLPHGEVGLLYRGARANYWRAEGGPAGAGATRFRLESGEMPPELELDCDTGHMSGRLIDHGEYTFDLRWIELECGGVSVVDRYHLTVRAE